MQNWARTPAYELALANQITYAMIAESCGVTRAHVSGIFAGRKNVGAKFADAMRAAFGPIADAILTLASERYEALEHERSARAEQRGKAPVFVREHVIDRIDVDFNPYPIDEWIARFGRPGGSLDIHGRANGTFATEPDYCELVPGDSPR
jgi:hypothetical protein